MTKDGCEGWLHDAVKRGMSIVREVYASPRRTDDDCIHQKGLHTKEILLVKV